MAGLAFAAEREGIIPSAGQVLSFKVAPNYESDPHSYAITVTASDGTNSSDQQCVAGFLPVVSSFQRPFGIDQHVGDILHVTDFPLPSPHFQKGVVSRTLRIGRIKQQHTTVPGPKA